MVIASRQLLILLVSIIGVCDVRCRESLTLDVYLAQSSIACRSPPKFIDLQPSKPDNRDLIGQFRDVSVHRDALEAAPKPFSAPFDELSPYL